MVLLEKKEGGRARWADAIGAAGRVWVRAQWADAIEALRGEGVVPDGLRHRGTYGVRGRARWADAIEARPTLGGGECRSGAPFAISRSALQSLLRRRIAHERGAQSI